METLLRDEKVRHNVLRSFKILDTPAEGSFDRLAHLAARICETPIAAVSLVDSQRVWFKSAFGLDICETARDISFCTHAIRGTTPFIVKDAKNDPVFHNNPLVVGPPYLGFYAGVPLITSGGFALGTLSVMDRVARSLSESQILSLQLAAEQVMMHLELRRRQTEINNLEAAVLKIAAGVSAGSGTEFFEKLACSMTETFGAQAGFVARFVAGKQLVLRTLSMVMSSGQVLENVEFDIEGTRYKNLLHGTQCNLSGDEGDQAVGHDPLAGINANSCVGRRLDNAAGQPLGLLCVLFREPPAQQDFIVSTLQIFSARAVTELEREEADTRIRDQASLLDKAQDAISVTGMDLRVTFWNKGAERLFGWTAEEAMGRNKNELIIAEPERYLDAIRFIVAHDEWSGEIRKCRKDHSMLTVESHLTLVRDQDGNPQSVLAIDTDISRRKADEYEIERLAFFDPLTRLPNRRLLLDRLQHALAASARHRHVSALLFIDLDNFKELNDTLGHDKGDLLLQQVARLLETCAPRKTDTVARLGGDEFVVMLEELSESSAEAASQAEVVGTKILAAFMQTFHLGGHNYETTPSIGVALIENELVSVDELLKRADLAMYQAKASGRNTIRFFDPTMQSIVNARVLLEADMRQAMQKQEFFLLYQAQTDLNGATTGAEALLRWRHPRRGLVYPSSFIPLAEETGLIIRLGEWVLETACRQLADWALRPETLHLTVAVNVSARQFRHPDFVGQVIRLLEETGADPGLLKLELTESLLIANVEDTVAKMHALKDRGVRFSLDDFGTGYSSLAYLKRLPLEQLKIDQSFIRDVLTDPNDAVIACSIVTLAQSLGLGVIAEGVETVAQRDFLAQHGCNAYQGFLFSQPLPAASYESH